MLLPVLTYILPGKDTPYRRRYAMYTLYAFTIIEQHTPCMQYILNDIRLWYGGLHVQNSLLFLIHYYSSHIFSTTGKVYYYDLQYRIAVWCTCWRYSTGVAYAAQERCYVMFYTKYALNLL